MIPQADIINWREKAPWATDAQVEQDLVLSRALIEIFSDEILRNELAFRGGTALNKIILPIPARYSEDIDLVQIKPNPIGETINLLRKRLDPWLGRPKRAFNQGRVILIYRFNSEIPPVTNLRLKIEINTREHFTVLGLKSHPLSVESRWFRGNVEMQTYHLEEMLGTKLRALYQRKKGRDIFDFAVSVANFPKLNKESVVKCFHKYMEHGGHKVSRAEYEKNLTEKAQHPAFTKDIEPLLSIDSRSGFSLEMALALMRNDFLPLLPGEPWAPPDKRRK
jgi:predicted nucleotidyltransferase component of viral defense system